MWLTCTIKCTVYYYVSRVKNTLFLFGEAKYSLNVTFPLQSCLLFSLQCQCFLWKKKKSHQPELLMLWKTNDAHKGWLSPCLKMTYCWGNSNLKRICFNLVLPRMAKCQVSTCPQFPCLYINMPTCVKTGFNLNPNIFSALYIWIIHLR